MRGPIDLEPSLRAWVERVADRPVVSARRHFAGASREAWNVDVQQKDGLRALFLLRDKQGSSGSARDAAVLRGLAATPIPVPEVIGFDAELATILLERLPGRSDFPAEVEDSEREPTARHLMELTGALHAIPPDTLDIPHLELPESAADCARSGLEQIERAIAGLGEGADPFFLFALGWLRGRIPSEAERFSLVHSDMGPGNFLFEGGRVTGIVDWEVAHFGDPMEDLAAIGVRDMATPIGSLPTRLAEYRASSGITLALDRIDYYRVLVLTRNSAMIGLGLAHPPASFDFVDMTMYQTSLLRAAALVICDRMGIERPTVESLERAGEGGSALAPAPAVADRAHLLAALRRDVTQTIAPALEQALALRRTEAVARGLDSLAHEDRVGAALDAAELADLAELLGLRASDRAAAEQALRARVAAVSASASEAGDGPQSELALYFARRLQRLAERRRPLMGALMERLPQRLEET